MSTRPPVNQGVVQSSDEDVLYEVVDDQVVELAPMGAYEVWIATVLVARLAAFATQYQLGRAVQEMLFDLAMPTARKRRPDVAFVSFSGASAKCMRLLAAAQCWGGHGVDGGAAGPR
jgi:Putative restriction endonuclease